MKHNRFFSILAVAVVLSLLMLAIPVTPVSAAPVIFLDIEKGQVGDKVTVEGSGFTPSTPPDHLHDVDIYFSRDALDVGDEIDYYVDVYAIVKQYVYTDDSGSFTKFFYVPDVLDDSRDSADVRGGTYYIYITYGSQEEIKAYAEFTVIGINEMVPEKGPVGTTVEINGVGFDGNDDLLVEYDGDVVDIVSGDRRVKGSGIFTSRIDIPESTAGAHTITVSDEGGHSGQIQFTVEPRITVSPAPASAGDELTISGTGFGEDVDIFVYFDGDQIYITGDDEAGDYGSFESRFLVPDVSPGTYLVEVGDDYGNDAEIELEVGPGLAISPATTVASPGNVGDTVTLTGSSFTPDATVEITYETDPVTLATVEADESGDFEVEITIPPSPAGEHTITATDGTSTKEATFIMESTPPPAPSPLLPAVDTKAKSKAEFDWGDVTDDSLPMTYELQVATNSQFTVDSILVNKIALTTSEYTLTDEEKLESTGEEAPYYWRVRAKDAASNASDWSSGSAFTVGLSFSMPGWLIYLLIAIGAIGVFILGYWLGRRSAVSEDYW